MKVKITIYDPDGEWRRDTLNSRIVDVRIEKLLDEFENNGIKTQIVRFDHEFTGLT